MRLVTSDGTIVAEYTYDPYGNILTATGDLAQINPLRYRGYYYDTELGMYYLNSRYYDPKVGRFINADNYTSTGQGIIGCNNFAYCGNKPVIRADRSGDVWETAFDIASLCWSVSDIIEDASDIGAWAGFVGDLVDLIPFVAGIGETVRAINTTRKTINNIDNAKDVIKAVGTTKKLHRPYIRRSTREAVEAATPRLPDGRFIDANTGNPINGKYDLGHVYGHEFWRERNRAMKKGWTQKQFNDYMNNPKFYQIEDPVNNRSHKYEKR